MDLSNNLNGTQNPNPTVQAISPSISNYVQVGDDNSGNSFEPETPVAPSAIPAISEPAPVDINEPIQPAPAPSVKVEATPAAVSSGYVDSSQVVKWVDTQNYITQLEKALGAKVIALYVSMNSSLAESDIDYLYNHVARIGQQEKIALYIYGPGGSGIAAYRIVSILRKYCKRLQVIVTSKAASAMTMMALGGDEILMGPLSCLSPIDSSIANHQLAPKGHDKYPVSIEVTQIQKFIELCNSGMNSDKVDDINKSPYALLSQHIHPVVIGTIQRIVSLSKMLTSDILRTHMTDEQQIESIVDTLNDQFPTHSYPITFEKAKDLGIPVKMMSDEVNELSLKFIRLLGHLSSGGSNENQGVKKKFSRDVIIESTDLRTVFYNERKYVFENNKWEYTTSDTRYIVFAPVKESNGVMRVRSVDPFEI